MDRIRYLPQILSPLLKLFFNLLYHQLAWAYDAVAFTVSLGRWKSWAFSALPYLTGPCVLEIGHGPGHLQRALNGKKIKVFGLDESSQMGRLAYRRIRNAGYPPLLVRSVAQRAPFPSGSFYQVAATFPSEYIFSPETQAELFRLLKPGGELIIVPAAWITGSAWYERLAAGLFRITGQAPGLRDGDGASSSGITLISEVFTAPMRLAGFTVSTEIIRKNSSSIFLIRAVKPDQNKNKWSDRP